MLRATLVLLAAGAVSGCAASASFTPAMSSSSNQSETQLAAYAGRVAYPTTMPASNELKAAAMVTPDQKTLKVYNFGSQPIDNADIWVNGAFVYHVDNIAPQSSVTIPSAQLYNSVGASFASQGAPFSRVQIKTDAALYTLWGPAAL
jgi:hypothetical protein